MAQGILLSSIKMGKSDMYDSPDKLARILRFGKGDWFRQIDPKTFKSTRWRSGLDR